MNGTRQGGLPPRYRTLAVCINKLPYNLMPKHALNFCTNYQKNKNQHTAYKGLAIKGKIVQRKQGIRDFVQIWRRGGLGMFLGRHIPVYNLWNQGVMSNSYFCPVATRNTTSKYFGCSISHPCRAGEQCRL